MSLPERAIEHYRKAEDAMAQAEAHDIPGSFPQMAMAHAALAHLLADHPELADEEVSEYEPAEVLKDFPGFIGR